MLNILDGMWFLEEKALEGFTSHSPFTFFSSEKQIVLWKLEKDIDILDGTSLLELSVLHKRPRNVVSFVRFCGVLGSLRPYGLTVDDVPF